MTFEEFRKIIEEKFPETTEFQMEQFRKMDLMQRQELFNNDRELYNELSK